MYRLGVKNTYQMNKNSKEVCGDQGGIGKISNIIRKSLIILSLTALIILMIIWAASTLGNSQKQINYKTITVENGQSLWEIARNNYGPEYDLRKIIYKIKKINKLENAVLHPGQEIKLPIK